MSIAEPAELSLVLLARDATLLHQRDRRLQVGAVVLPRLLDLRQDRLLAVHLIDESAEFTLGLRRRSSGLAHARCRVVAGFLRRRAEFRDGAVGVFDLFLEFGGLGNVSLDAEFEVDAHVLPRARFAPSASRLFRSDAAAFMWSMSSWRITWRTAPATSRSSS
ncbi:MAG TPA: hypothetical protein VFQ42_22330 [Mycobacterium sp.]|nr:hypothetical protein [Mycobacterium sp.]